MSTTSSRPLPSSRSRARRSVFGAWYLSFRATLVCFALARPRPIWLDPLAQKSSGQPLRRPGMLAISSWLLRYNLAAPDCIPAHELDATDYRRRPSDRDEHQSE